MTDPVTRQQRHFDAIAPEYTAARESANHLVFKNLLWAHFLGGKRGLFGPRPSVLEPMCGTADAHDIISRYVCADIDYEGFDVSAAMVSAAQKRLPDARLSQMDVTRYEPTQLFDLVVILGGLHHVPHAAGDVVERLARALRPGGYFLSWEPTQDNALFRFIRESIYARNAIFEPTSERAFSTRELRTMFEQAGFHLVDVLYPGLLSYVLYYNPDAFPRLNIGPPGLVRLLWSLERPFMRTWLARKLSFATLSLWRKN